MDCPEQPIGKNRHPGQVQLLGKLWLVPVINVYSHPHFVIRGITGVERAFERWLTPICSSYYVSSLLVENARVIVGTKHNLKPAWNYFSDNILGTISFHEELEILIPPKVHFRITQSGLHCYAN